MSNDLKQQRVVYGNESKYGIVNDLSRVGHEILLKFFKNTGVKVALRCLCFYVGNLDRFNHRKQPQGEKNNYELSENTLGR